MARMNVSNDNEKGHQICADEAVMDAYWAYELADKDVILLAGSLRTNDIVTNNGCALLLDLPRRADAETFLANDPAAKAGMRSKTEIRWRNVAIPNSVEQP